MSDWLKEMAEDGDLWELQTETLPEPVSYNYMRLHEMAKEGNVYGCLLQIKDVYEIVMKIPVISSLIYLDNEYEEELIEEHKISEKLILSPLAIGGWYELALSLLKADKRKKFSLAASVRNILNATKDLYNEKVSKKYSNISNWRNETIGHGMLRYEDNEDYKEEYGNLLKNLKKYLHKVGEFYQNVQYTIEGTEVSFTMDGTTEDVEKFIFKGFFLDSFYYRKKNIKYVNYMNGRYEMGDMDPFQKYIESLSDQRINKAVRGDYILKSEDDMYNCLNTPDKYIVPTELKERINDFMDENDKGVITVCMERGMGKTAFANSISGFYELEGLGFMDDAIVHTYCISATNLRGTSDFFGNLNFIFANVGDEAFRASEKELPQISFKDENPAEAMAEFLNAYKEIYDDEFDIERLVLVIDGLDELTEDTRDLGKWLIGNEAADLLDDGVYIIYTTRFPDEGNVAESNTKAIRSIMERSDECIEIHRDDPMNIQVMSDYISSRSKNKGLTEEDKMKLIEKADHRFLYLKIFAELGAISDEEELSAKNVIQNYLEKIFKSYDAVNRAMAIDFMVCAALFGKVSLEDYFDFYSVEEITYRFMGILNDLAPLLSLYGEESGRSYSFANVEYAEYILETYSDELSLMGDRLKRTIISYQEDILKKILEENDSRWLRALTKTLPGLVYLKRNEGLILDGWLQGTVIFLWDMGRFYYNLMDKKIREDLVEYSESAYKLMFEVTDEDMEGKSFALLFETFGSHSFLYEMYCYDMNRFDELTERALNSSDKALEKWFLYFSQKDDCLTDEEFKDKYLGILNRFYDRFEEAGTLGRQAQRLKPMSAKLETGDLMNSTFSVMLEPLCERDFPKEEKELAYSNLAASYALNEVYSDSDYDDISYFDEDDIPDEAKSYKLFKWMEDNGYTPQLSHLNTSDMSLAMAKRLGTTNAGMEENDVLQSEDDLERELQWIMDSVDPARLNEDGDVIDFLQRTYKELGSKPEGERIFKEYMEYLLKNIEEGTIGVDYFDLPLKSAEIEDIVLDIKLAYDKDDDEEFTPEVFDNWLEIIDEKGECSTPLYYLINLAAGIAHDTNFDQIEKYLYNFDAYFALSANAHDDQSEEVREMCKGRLICSFYTYAFIDDLCDKGFPERAEKTLRDVIEGSAWFDKTLGAELLNTFQSPAMGILEDKLKIHEVCLEYGLRDKYQLERDIPLNLDYYKDKIMGFLENPDTDHWSMNTAWGISCFKTAKSNHPVFADRFDEILKALYDRTEELLLTSDDDIKPELEYIKSEILKESLDWNMFGLD